jgi:hypothetical protein
MTKLSLPPSDMDIWDAKNVIVYLSGKDNTPDWFTESERLAMRVVADALDSVSHFPIKKED